MEILNNDGVDTELPDRGRDWPQVRCTDVEVVDRTDDRESSGTRLTAAQYTTVEEQRTVSSCLPVSEKHVFYNLS